MAKQNFNQPMDDRIVVVEIIEDSIDFFFRREVGNQWFYDIPKNEWRKDYPRWQDHMKDKRWFTEEMSDFINQQT